MPRRNLASRLTIARIILGHDLGMGIVVLENGKQRRCRRGAAGQQASSRSKKSRRFMPPWVKRSKRLMIFLVHDASPRFLLNSTAC